MPKDSVQIEKKRKPETQLDYKLLNDSIICNPVVGKERFSYKFNFDSTGYFLNSIIIYSDFKKIQKISVNQMVEENKFQLLDWNFDGYKDISVLSSSGSGGSTYFIGIMYLNITSISITNRYLNIPDWKWILYRNTSFFITERVILKKNGTLSTT